jgi:hypothetical protein
VISIPIRWELLGYQLILRGKREREIIRFGFWILTQAWWLDRPYISTVSIYYYPWGQVYCESELYKRLPYSPCPRSSLLNFIYFLIYLGFKLQGSFFFTSFQYYSYWLSVQWIICVQIDIFTKFYFFTFFLNLNIEWWHCGI